MTILTICIYNLCNYISVYIIIYHTLKERERDPHAKKNAFNSFNSFNYQPLALWPLRRELRDLDASLRRRFRSLRRVRLERLRRFFRRTAPFNQLAPLNTSVNDCQHRAKCHIFSHGHTYFQKTKSVILRSSCQKSSSRIVRLFVDCHGHGLFYENSGQIFACQQVWTCNPPWP